MAAAAAAAGVESHAALSKPEMHLQATAVMLAEGVVQALHHDALLREYSTDSCSAREPVCQYDREFRLEA